ncbi:MAG: hypothetical protein WCR69_08540 [Sulfuricurvum sp.]|jgi:hypothetical protein
MLDFVVILVMSVPMFLFSIYPGIRLSEYLERRYGIEESTKRKVMLSTMVAVAILLSSFVHFGKIF